MRKLLLAPLLLVALLLSTAAPAGAITGGKPDGNGHPVRRAPARAGGDVLLRDPHRRQTSS